MDELATEEANVAVVTRALPSADKEGRQVALHRLLAAQAPQVQVLANSAKNNTDDTTNTTAAETVVAQEEAAAWEARKDANMASQKAALTRQTMMSAAERKAMAEQAVLVALQKKGLAEEASKAATKVKALKDAAATKAKEDEAIQAAAQETSVAEVPKRMTRKDIADAKRAAKADAQEKAVQRTEEEQVAKDAAYFTAMENNNASHLINNPFSLPDNAKDWLVELVQYLPDEALGGEWRGCIKAFVTLNVDMGCEDMVSCAVKIHQRVYANFHSYIACSSWSHQSPFSHRQVDPIGAPNGQAARSHAQHVP